MRKMKRPPQKSSYTSVDVTPMPVPVPTGGWDAISPLAAMDPKNAVTLQNWVPRPGWCELRSGYNTWVSAINGTNPVETLMVYRTPTAEKLFAVCGGSIYDVSTQGTATLAVSGLSNSRFQYVNFSPEGSGVYYLYVVNGQDAPLFYNGTSWSNPSFTGTPNPNAFINISVYQNRIWFAINETTQFAYLAANAIQGALNVQDFGGLWEEGGNAIAMNTWTIDGGTGPNSYAAFLSSEGQISLYLGVDPTSVNTWNLVGTFVLPRPLGVRSMTRVGSDIAIITLQGVIPISQALPFDPSAVRSVSITSQIQNAMALAAQNYGENFGWEVVTFPAQTLVVLNVPIATNQSSTQYVMNALTGAWCSFTGWNANTFTIHNDNLYFGDSSGNVNEAYVGPDDNGTPILAVLECAFNYMNAPERIKRITMVQPMLVSSGNIFPSMQINVDFASTAPSAPITTFTSVGSMWDSAIWDSGTWSGGTTNILNWVSAEGIGRALSIQMTVNVLGASGIGGNFFDTGLFDTMVFDGVSSTTNVLQVQAFNVIIEGGGQI